MVGNLASTAAILDCDLVDAVCMQDQHIGVAGNRVRADHTAMVELHLQPECLQGNRHEHAIGPLLTVQVRLGVL